MLFHCGTLQWFGLLISFLYYLVSDINSQSMHKGGKIWNVKLFPNTVGIKLSENISSVNNFLHYNNNNNLFIYSALFNMLGDQKRITTINNLKTINTNIKIIQTYLISKRC